MSLTIQKQPDIIFLTGNPAIIEVSSDTSVISNHRIHVRMIGNGNIFEDSLPVIKNTASFDVSDYFKEAKKIQINIFNLFDTKIQVAPIFEPNYQFYVFETYNNDGIEHNTIGPTFKYVQQGGFSTIFLKNYNNELKTFYNQFMQVDKKFLTWSENKKLGLNQHEILYFIPLAGAAYYPKYTLYFSDNTTLVINGEQTQTQALNMLWFTPSYLANGFSANETENKIIEKYEVSLYDVFNDLKSEIKTYYIDRNYYNQERQFIFKNSLGGYDIIMLKGISESTDEIQRTVGFFQTEDITTFSSFKETFVANSGFLVSQFKNPKEAKQYIIELINSREIYEISGKEFIPVIPADKKIKISQDDNFLYAFEFNYQYSYADEFYSPHDNTQYLNPIILYRNGIVTNAIQGQLAVLDFEVMINIDINVDLEINWGADVGTTFINTTLVDGVWKPLQTSILIPANATLGQTIEITDSIGGKFSIPYTITEAIVITTDQSSLQTVGINLTFASGDIEVQWGDGTAVQAFATGVELTHDYAGIGNYQISIYGDLENITRFIADNSRITFIQGLKTGLLTQLSLYANLLTGNLDLSLAPISGTFLTYLNSNLTGITFAISGNGVVSTFNSRNCDLTGSLDLSNVPISGAFTAFTNSNLADIIFASSGNGVVSSMQIYSCDLTGLLDLSNVPISSTFLSYNNSNLTGIIFASSGNGQVFNFHIGTSDLTGSLDLSNVPISGGFQAFTNSNLTDIIFASSGNGVITTLSPNSCNLDYIDLTVGGISLAANNCNWQLLNNSMIVDDVNHILVDLYSLVSGEGVGGDYTGRVINISGTNAAPDGSSGGFDGTQAVIDLTAKGIAVTTS